MKLFAVVLSALLLAGCAGSTAGIGSAADPKPVVTRRQPIRGVLAKPSAAEATKGDGKDCVYNPATGGFDCK